jgi:ethanolaminephosphotransferase
LSFMFLSTCTIVQIGVNDWLPYALAAASFSFYLTQWEEYHTDILYLGYINVTEAQVFVMLIHLTRAYAGVDFYPTETEIAGYTFTYGQILILIAGSGTIFTGVGNICTVIILYVKKGEFLKLGSAFLQLIPLVQLLGCLIGWSQVSPESFYLHPHFALLGVGTLTAAVVGFIVLFRVAKQPYPLFHPILIPCCFIFIFHKIPALQFLEGPWAFAFGVYGIATYIICAKVALLEIGEIFGIEVFTIPTGGYVFNQVQKPASIKKAE